jgi:hypothetical protein
MNVISKKEPFEHIIVKDLYDNDELFYIMRETEFLYDKLGGPDKTNAAFNSDGSRKKSGRGLFLDDIYADRNASDILRITKKPFMLDELHFGIHNFGMYYKLFPHTNHHCTILQYYSNEDHYDSHIDNSLFTMIYTYYKTPKMFSGGDLAFNEHDYYVPIENNQLILFPSIIQHAVTKVNMKTNEETYGRFSIANLISWKT